MRFIMWLRCEMSLIAGHVSIFADFGAPKSAFFQIKGFNKAIIVNIKQIHIVQIFCQRLK